MGKAGARELNYVSDVDVIFVAEGDEDVGRLVDGRAVDIATRLAVLTMRGIDEPAIEPPLWEVDANLRPEGKDGALVRTLESHLAYYDRWAKSWEFQALLKARPLAGDLELGAALRRRRSRPRSGRARPARTSSSRVQRMRERVTDNIPDDEVDVPAQARPGRPARHRVHRAAAAARARPADDRVRQRGTLAALAALAAAGLHRPRASPPTSRATTGCSALLEHRLQLRHLRRTHLMPRDEGDVRVLARDLRRALRTSAGADSRWR